MFKNRICRFSGVIFLAAAFLPGCNKPAADPAPASGTSKESSPKHSRRDESSALAGPSDFFKFCCGDVVSVGFHAKYLTAGPGTSRNSNNWNTMTGGTSEVEHSGTRLTTAAEADEMMRKYYVALRKAAQDKKCHVEGAAELPADTPATGFKFSYTCKANKGEVVVTQTDRTEKEYQSKEKGKLVYTVKIVVSETIGKPE